MEQGSYSANPEPLAAAQGQAKPELTVCRMDGATIVIPRDIRDKWLRDPHRSPEWREVLRKFDDVFMGEAPAEAAVAAATKAESKQEEEPASVAADPWAATFPQAVTEEAKLGQVAHSFPHSLRWCDNEPDERQSLVCHHIRR